MDIKKSLTSISEVKLLLEELNHYPNKGLGQNYLIDANILDFLIKKSEIKVTDHILEVGPGLGALTERILAFTNKLTCVEKDQVMCSYLSRRFDSLYLIENDVLNLDLDHLFGSGINKVISNLPYSVASRLMIDITECINQPNWMYLTIQKEVADRLVSIEGSKSFGVLSILIGVFYKKTILKNINPKCFFPSPKVWSSLVQLEKLDQPLVNKKDYQHLKKIVKYCFSQRRKQLKTSLANLNLTNPEIYLKNLDIPPIIRPEQLSIKKWVELSNKIKYEIN